MNKQTNKQTTWVKFTPSSIAYVLLILFVVQGQPVDQKYSLGSW